MNSFSSDTWSKKVSPACSDVARMAQRELSAFFAAVKELFGREQAELSAEDWLHEMIEIEGLPTSPREWRSITAKVTARLASRVQALGLLTESRSV